MIAKRSSKQSVAHKVFVRSTKAGNAHKIFREQYLRDDVSCGSVKCGECSGKAQPDFKGDVVPPVLANTDLYCVVDTNICLKAIDLLEHPNCFTDVVIPHTVLEEVRNQSISVYTRLRALTSTSFQSKKRFYVYHNEFSESTFSQRQRMETVNDYNDRLIRLVTKYYNEHLSNPKSSFKAVLITNDRLNLEKCRSENILAASLHDYVTELGNAKLLDLVAIQEDAADLKSKQKNETSYAPYISTSAVLSGLNSQHLHQGKLSISRYNYLEASVSVQGSSKPFLVIGRDMMNRAFDGDKVVVELLPKSQWRKPLQTLTEADQDAGAADDEEQESSILSEKERLVMLEEARNAKPGEAEPTCKVVAVLKRNWRFYVGNISSEFAKHGERDSGALRSVLVRPMDKRISQIRIQTRRPNELAGKRIVVAVDDWPSWSRFPQGHFVKALGDIEDHQAETEAILLEHDIEFRPFPQAAMDCLPAEGDNWKPDELVLTSGKRRDLRDLNICSIDPPGCQDIDDALHAHVLPNGNYSLGVHIADVSHFVEADTPLDLEGALRATSTYLVDRRIDMLPSLLGTNLCSLKPYVERYAFSVIWEMTPDGNIVNTDFTKSLIKSREAFEYTEAQAKHDDKSQNDDLAQSLRILMKVSKMLKQKRLDAGALNLASPEVKIIMGDEMNDPTEVKIKQAVDTNSLVEEFMLLANITVAHKIYEHSPQTAMLRRHPAPPATNFDVINDQLRLKGFPQIATSSSKAVADSLDTIVDPKDPFFNTLIRILATRCMTSAEYFAAGNFAYPEFRHYGLATEIYTHFTSPIRRYADVIVHRQLEAAIGYKHLPPSHFVKANLEKIVDNNNNRHRNAQLAGRASVEYFVGKMLKSQKEPMVLEGYIIKVFSNGLGILVPKYGLESIIHIEDISSEEEPASFDESNYALILANGRKLSIFDKINVKVESQLHEATGKRSVKMTLG